MSVNPRPFILIRMLSLARRNVVAIVAATALTMDLVDTTAIVVALPTIQNEVPGADAASAGFVVTAYLVALAVSMTAAGWLTSRFGTRATFTTALLVFVVGSATCALAPNIGVLVAARVLQGLGGGVLVPVSLAAVLNAFPSDERNRASAIVSVPASVAPALGPLLGGAFTTGGDWRWLFLVNVPLGIAAAVIAARVLPGDRSDHAPFDLSGFVTGAVAVAALVVGLGSIGDATVLGLVLLVVGVVAVVLFVRHELRLRSPLLHLRLFGHTEMKWGITVMLAASAAYSALLLIVPSARQELLDESAFISGTLLTSHAVGVLVATPLAPRIVRRFGGRRVLVVGMVATAATTATLVAVVGAPFLAAAMVLFLGGTLSVAFDIAQLRYTPLRPQPWSLDRVPTIHCAKPACPVVDPSPDGPRRASGSQTGYDAAASKARAAERAA